jgi:hypothetical protein
VTSHSSQGQTADRVLVHVDAGQAGEKLVNRRLAYVAVSRGRYDAQVYTNDKGQLAEQLARDVSHRSATALMVRVRADARVIIENGARPAAVLHAAEPERRSISECIALAKAHEDETGEAPDPDFAEDVEEIVSHRKPWNPPA